MRQVAPRRGRSLGEVRALLGVLELDNIMSMVIFGELVSGALSELEQVGVRIDVFGCLNNGNLRLAPLLVVALLLGIRHLPTAFSAHVLAMLRSTPLGWHERPRG